MGGGGGGATLVALRTGAFGSDGGGASHMVTLESNVVSVAAESATSGSGFRFDSVTGKPLFMVEDALVVPLPFVMELTVVVGCCLLESSSKRGSPKERTRTSFSFSDV